MDADAHLAHPSPVIVVTGAACSVVGEGQPPIDPSRYLKVRKSRKFMGVQEDLAVFCAGRAIEHASLSTSPLGERAGLYLAVGFIPFREEDLRPVLEGSLVDGAFSMRRFAEEGAHKAHPLLTFRCLPNMPAYHVSVNFDVQGPYFVTYPGPGQVYLALEEAVAALDEGSVDVALVGAIAHQRNYLVEHHYRRIDPPTIADRLCDVGAMLVLERSGDAAMRGAVSRATLRAIEVAYAPFDALSEMKTPSETIHLGGAELSDARELGPARLLATIAQRVEKPGGDAALVHRFESRDSLSGESTWALGGESS